MKSFTTKLPMMYADHHVLEVRRILEEIPGVEEIYASSAFQAAEISYDQAVVSEQEILARLDEAGYLGEIPLAGEQDLAQDEKPFFRKAAVIEEARSSVSFAQNVSYLGRPLWPCPGVGHLKAIPEDGR